jgi:8-amino-7-oxononanoate synthase
VNDFDLELEERLKLSRDRHLLRAVRCVNSPQSSRIQMNGQLFLNFSSNDYLALADDPVLKEAAIRAVKQFGAGSGASRLICGSLAPFQELEETLADFKKTEAALTFSTGYATALGTICALIGKKDVIIMDKLVHASIVDAAKLSGAKIRVFAHNDMNDLESKLKWASSRHSSHATRHTLLVTESIFSMDGDAAPLREIVELKNRFGAQLMVDEAHATGIIGKQGRGFADELGVADQIEIQMGTLGKALGASGGYICGSRTLIDFLVNHARSFIFSTAPVPAAAAAATAAIQFVQSPEGELRRTNLLARVAELQSKIEHRTSNIQSAIVPIILGDETKAVEAASKLGEQNIFVPSIRYPTVARGKARLRITLNAAHSAGDVAELAGALAQIINRKS